MRSPTTVSVSALAAALALAGCGTPSTPANNSVDNQTAAGLDNGMAADNAIDETNTIATTVEDESAAPPVEVVTVPAPAPTTPATEAAPLGDAAAIEQAITAGTGITRVRQPDGWAWMRDGHIIRTASSDGRRVSYFRNGSDTPYLVQDGDHSYAYSSGRITHEYDSHGHASVPDANHQREAQQLADDARHHHDSADQASRTAPHVDRNGRQTGGQQNNRGTADHQTPSPDDGHHSRPTPTPTPTPAPTPSHHDGHNSYPSNGQTNGHDRQPWNSTAPHH